MEEIEKQNNIEAQIREIPELRTVERVTNLMDNAIRIPGTPIRFGLDPIIGLFPIVGDIISFAISGLMILSMVRYGVSGRTLVLMIGNIVIDFFLGEIITIGDIMDFGLKANSRNYKLLQKHLEEGKHYGSGWGVVFLVAAILIGIGFLLVYLSWKLVAWGLAEFGQLLG